MFNKLKKVLEIKKSNLDLENYYEKLGWQINKYFVMKIQPAKKSSIQSKHESEFLKYSIKIIILMTDLIKKQPNSISNIDEIAYQINEINKINIDEKNINIDNISQLLSRYYVLIPYLYVCQCSTEYLKHHNNVSIKNLVKQLTHKDLKRITTKSPKIIDIWKCICNEPELIDKFDPIYIDIFNNYIKF